MHAYVMTFLVELIAIQSIHLSPHETAWRVEYREKISETPLVYKTRIKVLPHVYFFIDPSVDFSHELYDLDTDTAILSPCRLGFNPYSQQK